MSEETWKNEIDNITKQFSDHFDSLDESQLNYKPKPGKWSIAQNISHLILLNNSYFKNFEEIKTGGHILPEVESMEKYVAESLQELRPYTMVGKPKTADTWNIWQPSQEAFSVKILDDFKEMRSEFKRHIGELQPFMLHPSFIKYPGEMDLVFRLEDCISFLIEHENRHLIQARQVR